MGNAMLTVDASRIFYDPTGKARAGRALCEDNFRESMDGWTQLFTPDSDRVSGSDFGSRIVSPLTRIARSGTKRISLKSPGIADGAVNPVQSMGIKRMQNMYGDGRYLLEMIVSIESMVSQLDRPISFGWGIDCAQDDGMRRFFKVRFWNYSETSSTVQSKWQVKTGTGSVDANYTDIPGATVNLMNLTNENKALPFYLALEVNTATGKYLGFRFGNLIKAGSLADTPDSSLSDLTVGGEALTTFVGGLNSCFDIDNRTSAGRTQSQSNTHWHRLSFLGA